MSKVSVRESPGLEDYLEAIGNLSQEEREVSVTEISEELEVKKPSVTSAVKRLDKKGLVEHESYGPVILTERGQELADEVARRHEILFKFFTNVLEIDENVANADACQIEHYLSETTLEKLSKFVDFLLTCPRGKPIVIENFEYYFDHGERTEEMKDSCE
ncbi:MAG: metal-dependent transcriptional regulator [Candidatus Acetothermia bacterium]